MIAPLEDPTPQQLKSRVRERIKEIDAGLRQFCYDLEEYFDNTMTYEEIKIKVATHIKLDDPDVDIEEFWQLIESYEDEGTQSGRDYETILGAIKKASLSVMLLDNDTIAHSTDEDLRTFMRHVEGFFSWAISYRAIVHLMPTLKNKNTKRQEARRKGGERRAVIYREIKDEVARLLHQEQPRTGWKSKAEAARVLTDHVAQFQKTYPKIFHIEPENLPDRILRWLYENETLKTTFEQIGIT